MNNRWYCYSKPTQSNTVEHIVLAVSDTQHPPFIKILIEKIVVLAYYLQY